MISAASTSGAPSAFVACIALCVRPSARELLRWVGGVLSTRSARVGDAVLLPDYTRNKIRKGA